MSCQDDLTTDFSVVKPLSENFYSSCCASKSTVHMSDTSRSKESSSIYRTLINSFKPRTVSCLTVQSNIHEQNQATIKAKFEQLKVLNNIDEEVQQFVDRETFKERFTRTFSVDPYIGMTEQNRQLQMFAKTAMIASGVFGIMQGVLEGRQKFMDLNKTTMFGSKMMSYKRRTNQMVKTGIEQGAKLWFKATTFSLCFMGTFHLIEIYFNKSSAWSIGVGLGFAGMLSRIKVGPKAMASSLLIGFVIGTTLGTLVLGARIYAKETQEDMNFQAVKAYITERKKFNIPYMDTIPISNSDDVEEAD
ncbi:Complex I assembly factor timmdc1 [Mactra antiquata]